MTHDTRSALSAQHSDWTPTERALPPDGQEVLTMGEHGTVQTLVRDGNLWFFPDRSMYVYYTPKFWRAL